MKFNKGSNGGWSARKARTFANGFKLGVESDDAAYKQFISDTILKDLGLATPAPGAEFGSDDDYHTTDYFSYVGNTGWGIQVYWDGTNPPDSGLPIDTYEINTQPKDTPTLPENPADTPDVNNSGEKTVIKLYADLYKDPNSPEGTQYYTQIVDIKRGVNISNLGGTRFKITDYKNVVGYAANGGQKYNVLSTTSTGASRYYDYKRLDVAGTSNYGTYNYKKDEDQNKTVSLGDANTIVVLYTHEMTHIKTTDASTTIDKNKTKDNSGNMTIVKLYGVLNPSTYEITDEKRVVINNTTRNVNIKSEIMRFRFI